jgi:hypothetical protein
VKVIDPEIDDSDNDDMEFDNAFKEEVEDKVIESIRKSRTGRYSQKSAMKTDDYYKKLGDPQQRENDEVIESVVSFDHDQPNLLSSRLPFLLRVSLSES